MNRFSLPSLLILVLVLAGCDQPPSGKESSYMRLSGETMGTTYAVTYSDPAQRDFKAQIDSLLIEVNKQVSTYDSTSLISRFNRATDSLVLGPTSAEKRFTHFIVNYYRALEIFSATDKLFDPTVMPLVNYWGFGYQGDKPIEGVDSMKVDSLLAFVGMEKVSLQVGENLVMYKTKAGVQLDFSAIAKGYGVDAVGELLRAKGITDFLVEIGGEVLASGQSPRGKAWKIGINIPEEGASPNEYQRLVPLQNRALATSGNYRQYYVLDGIKYSHTINPKTGFPERNRLLSASVFAPDCMTADAYATAFMVAGPEKALEIANRTPRLEAYLIVSSSTGDMGVMQSEGLKKDKE